MVPQQTEDITTLSGLCTASRHRGLLRLASEDGLVHWLELNDELIVT